MEKLERAEKLLSREVKGTPGYDKAKENLEAVKATVDTKGKK